MKPQHKAMLVPTTELMTELINIRLPDIKMRHSQSQKAVRPISANYVIKALNLGEEKIENSKGV